MQAQKSQPCPWVKSLSKSGQVRIESSFVVKRGTSDFICPSNDPPYLYCSTPAPNCLRAGEPLRRNPHPPLGGDLIQSLY